MPKLYRQPKFVLLLLVLLFGVLVAGCWYGYQKQLKNLEKQLYDLQHKMQTQRFMIHSRLFSAVPTRTFQYLFVLLFLACLSQAQTIRYVKQNGTGDGSSWANASGDLQAMINASGTSQVWVAKGTYYPTTNPTDRAASFVMKNGVAIYGGFMGTETNLNDRNWATNLTILSGDIDHATDPLVVTGSGITLLITGNSGNSYHVIFNDNNGLNSTAVLDGFTITGGYSSDAGGGMYNNYSSPSIKNCSFSGNQADLNGGGMCNNYSSPSLANCSFSVNWAIMFGAGMENTESSPSLVNCHFSGNKAGNSGGVMYNYYSSPNFMNCSFSGNHANSAGGAMLNIYSLSSFTNCSFSGNQVFHRGGGMENVYSSPSLINCSFSGNQAEQGGGISNYLTSSPSLKNCILWGNSSEVFNDGSSYPTYTKTLVKDLVVGGFQGTEDPLFVNQTVVGLSTAGDLRLQPCSPVINAGNNADNTTATDLDGNARLFDMTIDLGAYENQSALVITPSVSISHPTTCGGAEGRISLSGFVNSTTYSVTYKKNTNVVAAADFTSNESGVITLTDLGAGSYTDIVATYRACVSNAATATLTDPTIPTATISGTTTVCQNGSSPNITFTGQTGITPYTFTYKINEGVSQTVQTTGSNNSVTVPVPTNASGTFSYRLESVSTTNNCSQTQTGSATVTVNLLPTATISGTTTVCRNSPSPSITFTGSNATAPYTFTYKINDGAPQTVTTTSGNSVTVAAPTGTAGTFVYNLVSVSESSTTSCSQEQSGSVEVSVQGKPTITLTTLQQTLNEGNSQTFCDTDANPVNGLQFNVSGLCVVGNPVWRVQVGSGAWSDWSPNVPVSQLSNDQPHRYQAACDANCPVTYTNPIEVTINYRASTPQNVSLVADGVTVAVGETKEICNIEGNAITFNASCASGELVLYSVDGGEYSSTLPPQLVDGQYHNYRVRCRKSDGTVSCVETESGVMRLRIVSSSLAAPVASLNVTSGCGSPVAFSGITNCGALTTIWYNAVTNVALPSLPNQTPTETTSYYARCQTENGCVSEKSNVVTFTLTPTQVAPVITASQEIVCTGTTVTISANCPAGSQTFWNTGVTASSFEISFSNVTKQSYWAKCLFEGGCQSAESARKDVYWNAFVVTLINIGESKSAIKTNDRAAWSSQFVTRDGGPELEQSTQVNPTLYFAENVNKTAPRYWTVNVEACGLSNDGSLTFDMLATPETGVIRSFNTHENNAPYFMYANRDGWTELYGQNHPAYGFYQDNGVGSNVYGAGLPKGLYKLGIRYWDQKGWGSIYPSTRKPQGNVLAYQEYWFRIQSKDGVGVGAARQGVSVQEARGEEQGSDNGKQITDNGTFATVLPNPVTNILRLKVQNSKGQVVQTSLTDASGREVLRRQFVAETNTHQEEFGVSELPTAMYFLQVTTETQQATLKVVKAP